MKLFLAAMALSMAPLVASAQDITGVKEVSDVSILRAGQFYWNDDAMVDGAVYVRVNLATQMAQVYRGDMLIGLSTISSGKPGKETPTGVFKILQKAATHRSNKYANAPMPFMQRLTWDGIALHAGHLPGYPASHGCIRLPKAFAALLFAATQKGDRVEVVDDEPYIEGIY